MTVVELHPIRRRPCVRPEHSPGGFTVTTVMFTDIVGSSHLIDRLGDIVWLRLMREHNALVRAAVVIHGGREIKTTGDGFMVAFASARAGLRCAIAIHQVMAGSEGGRVPRMRLRIGLHSGRVQALDDDLLGRDVVVAARITAHACADEILVSGALRELVRASRDCRFGRAREIALRGLSGHQVVHRALWPVSACVGAAAPLRT